MAFFNCGAYIGNRRPKSKKELKDALASQPETVYFDGTSIDRRVGGYKPSDIPADLTLTVVIPDPYRDRRAYASVSRKADGSLKVT